MDTKTRIQISRKEYVMIQYFYYLEFKYEVDKDKLNDSIFSTFSLGYFSSKKKALEKIEFYRNIVGFNKHPVDCFKIVKMGVQFENKIINKSIISLYELYHEYYVENEDYDVTNIVDLYESEKKAKAAIKKYVKVKPYKLYPDNFQIFAIEVDCKIDSWAEGFVSWDDE